MTESELATELEHMIAMKSEEEVRSFVIEHFAEFPPETQQALSVELLQEALETNLTVTEGALGMKEKTAEAIDEFERLDKDSN